MHAFDTPVQRTFVYTFGQKRYDLAARTHIMGVLNVTPDSFSDGGRFLDPSTAVRHGLDMIEAGADFLDVGGESTRPKSQAYGEGADDVPVDEEIRRVIPVIERLARQTSIPISIDTHKATVADQALRAGAVIVNDISGLTFDAGMPHVVANHRASAVLMHIKGTPKTMQQNPHYDDLFGEVLGTLQRSLDRGIAAGVEQLIVDPGIGFGKRQVDNVQLIAGLSRLKQLGYPILIGPSRKSFIGTILDLPIDQRLEGTLAAVVASILNGANIIRVHDVKEARRAALVADAVRNQQTNVS